MKIPKSSIDYLGIYDMIIVYEYVPGNAGQWLNLLMILIDIRSMK